MAPSLLPRPLVYAHRGGAALRPENTVPAFDHGLSVGADGLELDVHLSADGVVVVHHDATLERTTDGRGPVAGCRADDLARLDAAYRFGDGNGGFPYRGRGIRIPRLDEVLGRYPGIPVIVELKSADEALARAVVGVLRAARALERVAVGSFHVRVLREVRRLEPAVPTGAGREEIRWALYRSRLGWPARRTPYRELQVPETSGRTTIVTPRFLRHAHRAGLPVKVWTVDERSDVDRLFSWGVDAVISDRPDIAVTVRDLHRQAAAAPAQR